MVFVLQSFKEDTLASDITDSATSMTLSTGAFGTPTGEQMLVIDYDVAAKREIVKCAIDGTAVTSIDRAQDGTSAVAHSSGAKVIMAFVPSHYKALTDFVGARATTTTLTTSASATPTKIVLNSETYDVGANFADGTFTAPVAGYYDISACVTYGNITAAAKIFHCHVYKGGTTANISATGHSGAAGTLRVTTNAILHLDAGDTIELYYEHNDATTVDISTSGTFLSVVLINAD